MSVNFTISRHAVDQYRARVVMCCERERSDKMLRKAMAEQLRERSWRLAGGETFVVECGPLVPKSKQFWKMKLSSITHMFVVECQTVVTTLGYMMRPAERKKQRRRRRLRLRRIDMAAKIAALPRITSTQEEHAG